MAGVLAALVLVLGVVPLVVSLHSDVGDECSGVGGVVRWYVHDRPDREAEFRALEQAGETGAMDVGSAILIVPCDDAARGQVLTSITNVVGVLLLGAVAVAVLIWRSRRRPLPVVDQPADSDQWRSLPPPSPPERDV